MIESALRTRALAVSAVSDLIVARMYPLKLPQAPSYPAVSYTRVSGPRLYAHDGAAGMAEGRFQFDVWAASYASAKAVGAALRGALEGFVGTSEGVDIASIFCVNESDEYNPEEGDGGDWRVSLDFWVRYYE